jgi:hypothetical protein
VGHPAQRLPLRRRAPGHHVPTTRAMLTSAMRWGFGMQAGPVRAYGRRPAGWTVAKMVQGRHRRGQGAVQHAAARVGVQGSGGRGGWRAHGQGLVERVQGRIRCAPRSCRSTRASISPRRCGLGKRCPISAPPAPRCSKTTRSACGRSTASSASSPASRPRCTRSALDVTAKAWRGRWSWPRRATRAW